MVPLCGQERQQALPRRTAKGPLRPLRRRSRPVLALRSQLRKRGPHDVAGPTTARPVQDRTSDRAGADGGRGGRRAGDRGGASRRARLAAGGDVQRGADARADGDNSRCDAATDQLEFLRAYAAGAEQCARARLARGAQALLRRIRHRSGGAGAVEQPHAVRRGILRGGGRTQAGGGELPLRLAGGRAGQARQGGRLHRHEFGDHGGRGALAGGAWLRRGDRARLRGRRPSRHVPDRQSGDAGRHLRAGAAGRRCGESAGDRRRRHHRRARHRRGLGAGRVAVQIGTAYLFCPESIIKPPHRAALAGARAKMASTTARW